MGDLRAEFLSMQPEVDYQALMAPMHLLSHPRRKLKEMQNKGQLIRLKKGFYVFSPEYIGRAYSTEIVANLLYGPSYVSMEYALAHYGLIPERVDTLTSVTSQKNKTFDTSIGSFTYTHLHAQIYPIGITIESTRDERHYLIATLEKALMDVFTLKFKNSDKPTPADLITSLEQDLRIDIDDLRKRCDQDLLKQMQKIYRYRRWNKLLLELLLEAK